MRLRSTKQGRTVARTKKVPFRQQLADTDCGAAALAMVLEYYGADYSLPEVKAKCERFGPPQSTSSLIKAAREYGMRAALVASEVDALPSLGLPAILYWNFSHFVVLESIDRRGRNYRIVDPAYGRLQVSQEEFSRAYTGIAIDFEPTANLVRRRRSFGETAAARLLASISASAYLGLAAHIVFATVLLQALSLTSPFVTYYLFETVVPSRVEEAMPWALAICAFFAAATFGVSYLRSSLVVRMQSRVDRALLTAFVGRLLRLPASFLPLLNFEWVFCGADRVKGGPRGMRPGAAHP
jgi:ATP-binding cassette subfamily B protein